MKSNQDFGGADLLRLPLAQILVFDAERDLFFANVEGMTRCARSPAARTMQQA